MKTLFNTLIGGYMTLLCLSFWSCSQIQIGPDTKPHTQTPTPGAPIQVNYIVEVRGNTVIIDNQSEGADSYVWNYGDGHVSSAKNPEPHTYDDFGLYNLTMTASLDNYEDKRSNEIKIQWQPRNLFPGSPRFGGLTLESEGYHYMGFGGNNKDWWKYDPSNDKWEQLQDCPVGIHGIESIFLSDNKIYAVYPNHQKDELEYFTFNLQTETWSSRQTVALPEEIDILFALHPPSFVYESDAYLIGQKREEQTISLIVWKFDLENQVITLEKSWQAPMSLINYTDGYFQDGQFYLIGSKSTYVYHVQQKEWGIKNGFRTRVKHRYGHRTVTLSNHNMLVVGGADPPPLIHTPISFRSLRSAHVSEYFLPSYAGTEVPSSAPFSVISPTLLPLPKGAILLGGTDEGAHAQSVWEYRSF